MAVYTPSYSGPDRGPHGHVTNRKRGRTGFETTQNMFSAWPMTLSHDNLQSRSALLLLAMKLNILQSSKPPKKLFAFEIC